MLLLDGAVCNEVPSFTSGCLPNHRALTSLEHPLVHVTSKDSQTTSQLAQWLSKGNQSYREKVAYQQSLWQPTLCSCQVPLIFRPIEKGAKREREWKRERGRKTERWLRRGETRNAMSQRHLSAQMKWKQWKGNTALLFSKLYFQLNESKRKYPFLFLCFERSVC